MYSRPLPVTIAIGNRAVKIGTVSFDEAKPAGPQLAELFRAFANSVEKIDMLSPEQQDILAADDTGTSEDQ